MKSRDYITAGAYYRLMKDMLIEANKGIITALHLNKKQQNEFYKVLEKWRMLETKLGLENMAVNDTNFNGRTIDLFYGTVTDKNISYSDTDKQIMEKINEILTAIRENGKKFMTRMKTDISGKNSTVQRVGNGRLTGKQTFA